MHGCKKKSRGCLNRVFGDYFLAELNALSFFCVGDFQVLTRGSELKIFFAFMCNRIDILSGKKKNKLKNKFSSLVGRQMNSPHNMFSAASSQIHIICFQTSVFVYHLSCRLFS